ncbi:hypothetical protein ABZP36_023485 [Zizania latifolia]
MHGVVLVAILILVLRILLVIIITWRSYSLVYECKRKMHHPPCDVSLIGRSGQDVRDLFFDAAPRTLAAATAALRVRLYGLDERPPSHAFLALKRRPRIDAGVSRVEEVEEPLQPALALACANDPASLGGVDSPIIRLVAEEYGVGGDVAPFICLGGFRNTRAVYQLEEGETLGLVLELKETRFDFGTHYELECETVEPDRAKEVLERLLTVAGVPYELIQRSCVQMELVQLLLAWSITRIHQKNSIGSWFKQKLRDCVVSTCLRVLMKIWTIYFRYQKPISVKESMTLITCSQFAETVLFSDDTGVPHKSRTSALFIFFKSWTIESIPVFHIKAEHLHFSFFSDPGQLNFYDGGSLFSVQKSEEGKVQLEAQKFLVAVLTTDPNITVTNLYSLTGKEYPNISLKKFCVRKTATPFMQGNMKWPLTGGVPSEMSLNEDHVVERIYIAGYQDSSVRIWDATFPVLVVGVNLDGENSSVSSLAFCSLGMTLAVGTTSGLVRIYKLREHTGGSGFHFVTESNQEALEEDDEEGNVPLEEQEEELDEDDYEEQHVIFA